MEKSFAKDPVTTVTGVLSGKTKVLQEREDKSGAALTDDSFARLAALAEDGRAWDRAWNADVGAFIDWQKTRNKVLAAQGDRNRISRAIAEFESEGSGRSSTVERALGKTGIAFEFPDAIADQKPVYDALIVGNPIGHARELAQRGQQEAVLNELNAANDKLGKLIDAANAHGQAFESSAKLAEMLNRVTDRRGQLRGEIRQLTRGAKPQAADPAPKPEIGPPTEQQAADAEAKKQGDTAELETRRQQLIADCSLLRRKEAADFAYVRQEMDSWHFDHLSASIDMAQHLKRTKDSYSGWQESIQKLKTTYQELGQDPTQADALAPDRRQWDAVNGQWQTW